MKWQTKKKVGKFLSVCTFIVVVAVASFVAWVGTAPRYIPYVSSSIESTLNDLTTSYKITSGKALVRWDGVRGGVKVDIPQITIIHPEKGEVASFIDAELELNFLYLLIGKVQIDEILLKAPEIRLIGSEPLVESEVPVGPRPMPAYQKMIIEILSQVERNNLNIPLKSVRVEHARIIFKSGTQDMVWYLPSSTFSIIESGSKIKFVSNLHLDTYGKITDFKVESFLEGKDSLRVRAEFTDILPSLLTDIFPNYFWLKDITIPLSGHVLTSFDDRGRINNTSFRFTADDGVEIDILGSTNMLYNYINGDEVIPVVPEIMATAKVNNMPMDDLSKFWPKAFAKPARKWVIERLTGGVYSKAEAKINIKAEHIISRKIPKEALTAKVEFYGGRLHYFKSLPDLENAAGSAEFNGNSMDLKLHKGKIEDSEVGNVKVKIYNIGVKGKTHIDIDGELKGPVGDIIVFHNLKKKDDKKNNFTKDDITGKAETDFILRFPITRKLKPEQVYMEISSRLSDIAVPNIVESFNASLSDGQLSLFVNNDKMLINGRALFNKSYADITYTRYYIPEPEYDRKITFKSVLTPQELSGFNIPHIWLDSGDMDIDLSITTKDKNSDIVGKIGLTNTVINAKQLGWKKDAGKQATLSFSVKNSEGQPFDISGFQVLSDDFIANGKGQIAKEEYGYSEIYFENIKFADNDFELRITKDKGNEYRVSVAGKSINLEPLLKSLFASKGDKKDRKPYAIEIVSDLDRMFLMNGAEMRKSVGVLKCEVAKCNSIDFAANFADGTEVKIRFAPIVEGDDTRHLKITSNNAGMILRGLNILKHIKGGVLDASAHTNEKDQLVDGKVMIKHFKVTKAPLLAKLLNIASFAGIVELMEGKGIKFKKLKGEFAYKDRIVELVGIKASGGSLGITTDGYINTNKGELDLDGAIIPSYSINSMFGKIPLIGRLLGGREGEGLIASRYQLRGSFDEPKIAVNPLSMLTPGFLRMIWGGKNLEYEAQVKKGEVPAPDSYPGQK